MLIMDHVGLVFAIIGALGLLAIVWAAVRSRGSLVRYVSAMTFAILGALLASIFIASPIAANITAQLRFDSPDGVETIHAMVWFGIAIGGLAIGWLFGWTVSHAVMRARDAL